MFKLSSLFKQDKDPKRERCLKRNGYEALKSASASPEVGTSSGKVDTMVFN